MHVTNPYYIVLIVAAWELYYLNELITVICINYVMCSDISDSRRQDEFSTVLKGYVK